MVTVTVPRATLLEAENERVTEQSGLHGLLLKTAVTPLGSPEAVKVTSVEVPLTRATSIDEDGLVLPRTTVRLFGEGVDRPKSKTVGAVIVRDSVVE